MDEQPSPQERAVEPTRILIADDHVLFRSGLRELLGRQADLEVVAEAATGREAVEHCRLLRPEVVLMDVCMPDMDGIAATEQIKQELPDIIVLILSAFEDRDYLLEALKAGAAGYVLKYAPEEQLKRAIREAVSGEYPLDEGLAKQLLLRLVQEKRDVGLTLLANLPGERSQQPLPGLEGLSAREGEALRLLMKGQTNREIAKNMSISLSTAKQHVRHIIAKLGVSDRTQAAIKAIELGLRTEREGE